MAERYALTVGKAAMEALGRAAGSIGLDGFYQALLEALGCCLAHDLAAVMRYSPFSQPDLLLGTDYGPDFSLNYANSLYRYDPFYRYWTEITRPGVITLADVVTTEADQQHYVSAILSDVSVTDEIVLFLPPVGRSSIALFLDRRGGTYSSVDISRAKILYDLIAGLHTAHVNAVFGSARPGHAGMGTLMPDRWPTRVLDRGGDEISRNCAWSVYDKEHGGVLAQALPQLAIAGRAPLAAGLILHRTALPTTFHLAPCGSVETIEPLGLSPIAPSKITIPDRLGRLLSRREQDIVGLMLRGYPTKLIAGRLGLTQGTIKNYRRRIYDKLDVTTEREVFLSCVAAAGSAV